ncbi:MAG: PfkB family carbohydrate kinase [Pseudomonadota bacterium]
MTILCIGSVNIDNTHRVTTHPGPGETVLDKGHLRGLGGKGANMSLAAAAAGARVAHAGAVGSDGDWCRNQIADRDIDVSDLSTVDAATGHAIIMVDDAAENVIVVHSGANMALSQDLIDQAISRRSPGDWLLLQNETNLVPEAAAAGQAAGLKVAYAAAPFDAEAVARVLPHTDLLAVNQIEAEQLSAHLGQSLDALNVPAILITLGSEGARYRADGEEIQTPAFQVDAVDTTGAGDTFLGFFLAGIDLQQTPDKALRRAAAAAALQVTRPGAGDAIPSLEELEAFLSGR